MEFDTYRYDDLYGYDAPKRVNWFVWSIVILLLTAFAFTTWIGSYYIFGQPERADSYRWLKKLKKIEAPKRFELTAAPAGEFLKPKQLYERFIAMRPAELAKANAELARNYIRNFQQVHGLVPYVVGRFNIIESRELRPTDLFTSGVVALTRSVDMPEVLLEHLYTADARNVPFLQKTMVMGLDVKLERTHDLSAIIHAERLADGRMQFTAIPLLYGSYTVTRGTGTFSLEPPLDLNLAAGWPVFKNEARRVAETHYDSFRERQAPATGGVPIAGPGPSATPASTPNELVRVEPAQPVEGASFIAPTPAGKAGKRGKIPPARIAKGATPPPPASATPAPLLVKEAPLPTPLAAASAAPMPTAEPATTPLAQASLPPAPIVMPSVVPSASPVVSILPAISVGTATPGLALASTTGANWRTFPAGKMPVGRLVGTGELKDVADRGTAGQRVYLRGQFVVNFADVSRAVLRPKNKLTDSVLHFGAPASSTRIIVDYPSGVTPPTKGSVVNRDEARPYEITEVRRQADGQLNVFVREIITP